MSKTDRYDGIVIGFGIGGLTAASLLSKEGWKILLLEKEKQAGGYVVSFRRGERPATTPLSLAPLPTAGRREGRGKEP